MKKFLLITAAVALILSCNKNNPNPSEGGGGGGEGGGSMPSDIHLKQGLLVWLPFNGNFADSSGNNNPTTAVNGAALSYDAHGYDNQAFMGNNVDARVLVGNNGSIHFDTAFTVSVNGMISRQQRQAFVTMTDNTTALGTAFGFGPGLGTINNLEFSVCDNSETCSRGITATAAYDHVDTTQLILDPYAWYNLIATYSQGTVKIYVNGKLISTYQGAGPMAMDCPGSKIIVGGWWDQDPAGLTGKISDFRLYNRVLNADEIAQLASDFQFGTD